MSNEKNKVESNIILDTDSVKDILIKQAITNIFLMLKEQKKTHRLPEDIEKNDLWLYKKIRRLSSLRDENNKIKRSLIECLGREVYPESVLLNNELKLKQDFQKFLKDMISNKYTIWNPSNLTKKQQWLYKRIKREDKYIHPEKGYIEWDRVHNDLGWEYSTQIKVEFQAHIEYTDMYIQKMFSIFFDKLEKKWESTRSPQRLDHYDGWLYSHIIKNKVDEKNHDLWDSINKKYWRSSIIFTYQPYTDTYIKQKLDLLYTNLKSQWRKAIHPQDIHLFDFGLFKTFGQKKFRWQDGKIDRDKVAKKHWEYSDMPLKRNDRIYNNNIEKELFQKFFLLAENKYRSPKKVKKFDNNFYSRLIRVYRRNNKPDRLYILIHIVTNEKQIKKFSHKTDDLVKTKLKHSSVTDNIDNKLYKLSQDDLNPEENIILQEEIKILHSQISLLNDEDKKIIEDFYNEIVVDNHRLNTIIKKIKENISSDL